MKIITLSDHTGDMIAEAEKDRKFQYERQQAVYDAEYRRRLDERDRWRSRYDDVRVRRDRRTTEIRTRIDIAWSDRRYIVVALMPFWLVAVGCAYMLWEAVLSARYKMPIGPKEEATMAEPTERENAWRIGNQGETEVVDHLRGRFSDEWVLIGGYLTAKGEIDQVLIGPQGVMALEIKNIGGTIHIDGENWWRRRREDLPFDPVKDGGGRSPAQQLDATATELERVLSRHMINAPEVIRTVVMANPLCEIQSGGNISGVHLVSKTQNLGGDLFRRVPTRLNAGVVGEIVERIREDHALNEKKSSQRGTRFGGIVSEITSSDG